VKVYRQRRKKK